MMMDTKLLTLVVVGGLFFVVGQYIASQPQRAEQEVAAQREITVQGSGDVTAVPDVAVVRVGLTTGVRASAEEATNALAEQFEGILAAVRSLDVAEEDITTENLSVNPQYDFANGRQTLRGFEATETVRVKVRQPDRTGEIIAAAAAQGANQIGGVTFEIDDPDALQEEAQEKAIADARENAESLARSLDVNLGRVKNFNVTFGVPPGPPIFARGLEAIGGDAAVQAPPVPEVSH
jgi:uncharacterized protein YggE